MDSSATDNDSNDIVLTTTAVGDIVVDLVKAGVQNDVKISAAGAIAEQTVPSADPAADIVADQIELVASTGIGSTDKLEINVNDARGHDPRPATF